MAGSCITAVSAPWQTPILEARLREVGFERPEQIGATFIGDSSFLSSLTAPVPSLTDDRGVSRVKYCAHARAIENQILVCVSPLVGDLGIPVERPIHGAGEAFVAAPIDNNFTNISGLHAAESGRNAELLIAELDIGLVRATRAKSEIRQLTDRRADLYPALKPELV